MGPLQYIIFFSLIFVLHAASVDYKSYEGYKLFLVEGKHENRVAMVERLKKNYDEMYHTGNRTMTKILISPDLVPLFRPIVDSYGLKATLLVDDYSKIIRIEKARPLYGGEFSWHAYYDIDDIHKYLENVSRTYPETTELIVGGKSYEGRRLLGVRINTPRNGTDKKEKPVMFIESGIHAREWIAHATTTYFINQLMTSSNPEIAAMKDQFDWRIFPCVNPDGYHYSFNTERFWRKTRSPPPKGSTCYGVDPNRNWDYHWMNAGTSSDPCAEVYGGTHPFSEVETTTLSEYVRGIKNLVGYISYHSYAQILLVPYSDSKHHFDNYDDLIKIGNTSLDYGYRVNGVKYDSLGTAAEILYSASGVSTDWVRNTLNTPLVYTYELRGENFHWPPTKIPEQGDEVTQMMLGLVKKAKDLGYF